MTFLKRKLMSTNNDTQLFNYSKNIINNKKKVMINILKKKANLLTIKKIFIIFLLECNLKHLLNYYHKISNL